MPMERPAGATATSGEPTLKRKRALKKPRALPWLEFSSFVTYIFDCDGVIWGVAPEITARSVAVVNRLLQMGKRVMFVTNNSNKSRLNYVKELEQKGVRFPFDDDDKKVDMMVSSAYTTARYLALAGLKRPYVITSDTGLLDELRLAGITEYYATVTDSGETQPEFAGAAMKGADVDIAKIIDEHLDVDSIVVGWDMGFTALKIATAVNFIKAHEEFHGDEPGFKPMPIIACAGDPGGVFCTATIGGRQMKVAAIGNGAMADAIARCFDPPRPWEDMGKPSECLLKLLACPEAYHVDLATALMVGDTLATDIVFGNKGNMSTLLVLSGVTTQREFEAACVAGDNERIPHFVLNELGDVSADDGAPTAEEGANGRQAPSATASTSASAGTAAADASRTPVPGAAAVAGASAGPRSQEARYEPPGGTEVTRGVAKARGGLNGERLQGERSGGEPRLPRRGEVAAAA